LVASHSARKSAFVSNPAGSSDGAAVSMPLTHERNNVAAVHCRGWILIMASVGWAEVHPKG
jgi:hypothetical protein